MLENFKSQAIQAHYNTSHSPERRGENLINEFDEQFAGDIAELQQAGIDQEQIDSYVERYKRYFGSWLAAKSRCISSMITGPARFPVRRAEKANRSEENHYAVFQEWRKKAKKAIIRKSQPEKTYESEIDRYKKELAGMQKNQEKMKEANKIIKNKKLNLGQKVDRLLQLGFSEGECYKIQRPDFAGRVGFPSYALTNNNANMKRVEGRIAELEAKEAMKQASAGVKEIEFESGKIVVNYEIDRVQIIYPGKPSPEVINLLKSKAFKWAPSQQAWQRQITQAAIYAASHVTGIGSEFIK